MSSHQGQEACETANRCVQRPQEGKADGEAAGQSEEPYIVLLQTIIDTMADDDTGGSKATNTSTLVAVEAVNDDEKRAIKKRKTRLGAMVRETVLLLELIEENPGLLATEEFKDVRDLLFRIADNPSKYPRALEVRGWGKTVADLTPKIAKAMYHRSLSTDDLDGGAIVLQVVQIEELMVNSRIGSSEFSTRKLKMAAIDGDGMPIMLRVDSTLNAEAATMLTEGTIVAIPSFVTLYFNYDDGSDLRCAIVANSFERVGYQPIDEESNRKLDLSYTVLKTTEKAKPSCSDSLPGCDCGGKLCSRYGLNFIVCLTECIPVETVSLELVIRDCIFATKNSGRNVE
ncbi:hypothetical protein THAOC_20922 [Thalassiosira oceanica]|uniref:Uncharacterized protein n=1 Tax=Thalassiosira oceanica TaxID=159749 RepID=K0SKA4_THAOC|nr:hypothetical protein THAOC_20922 [Thalassiosira oceanica]|eukprot:EJK58917.1 hypothetical protein THAOC_20922 [Thalassiosira oceanica]